MHRRVMDILLMNQYHLTGWKFLEGFISSVDTVNWPHSCEEIQCGHVNLMFAPTLHQYSTLVCFFFFFLESNPFPHFFFSLTTDAQRFPLI